MTRSDKIISELKRIGLEEFTDTIDKNVYLVNKDGSIDIYFTLEVQATHNEGYPTSRSLDVRILTKKSHYIHCGSFYRELKDLDTISLDELKSISSEIELAQLGVDKRALGLRLV